MQPQEVENGDRFTARLNIETIISLIVILVNIISCSYVLNKTIRKISDLKWTFYFAISYLMYSITQIVNLFINNSSLSQPGILNGIFGKFSPTFLTANLLLLSSFEFLTIKKIKRRINIETRKNDIYIWEGILLLSWVASIFGVNRYEQLELRYAIRPNIGFEYHTSAALILFILLSAVTFYFELKRLSRKIISREFINEKIGNFDHMNLNMIRTHLYNILPFLLQWSLILIYNIVHMIGNKGIHNIYWNIFLIIAVNIGGIGHAISYFIYERKYPSTNFANPSSSHPNIPSYGTLPTDDQIITISA